MLYTGLLFGLIVTLPSPLPAQFSTRLSQQTTQAFEDYRTSIEAKLDWKPRFVSGLKVGEMTITPCGRKGSFDVKDGLVHDWVVAAIVPHVSPERVIAVLQDYDAYKRIYNPDVRESKVVHHDGDRWHVYLQLVKKKVLTVLLNAEFDVEYHSLGDGRWSMISRSTRIAEMDGARELPAGQGYGFLWRLNAYWLIEPRPEGVYIECRTLSLSRDIPNGLGWLIKPFVTAVPRESLEETMQDTVRALR